jgi:hypothetical protein
MPPRPRRLARAAARRLPALRRLIAERDELRSELDRVHRIHTGEGYDFLFMVTYGRSGSTLLNGILNSIPGYLIRGENHGATRRLFLIHHAIDEQMRQLAAARTDTPTHPWFGIKGYPRRRALDEMRAYVIRALLRPEPDSRVIGFKEIRWSHPQFEDYVRFMADLFPTAKFLFNTRDHEAVARSKWWANAQDPLGQLQTLEARFAIAEEELGPRAYRVHYDDYVADVEKLRGMFAWLGERFDPEAVREVMARPHSY